MRNCCVGFLHGSMKLSNFDYWWIIFVIFLHSLSQWIGLAIWQFFDSICAFLVGNCFRKSSSFDVFASSPNSATISRIHFERSIVSDVLIIWPVCTPTHCHWSLSIVHLSALSDLSLLLCSMVTLKRALSKRQMPQLFTHFHISITGPSPFVTSLWWGQCVFRPL